MTTAKQRIEVEIEKSADNSLNFLKALIRAGQQGEAAVQQLVYMELEKLGCQVETIRYSPGDVPMVKEFASQIAIDADERSSVIGCFKGTGGGRSLMLFAHPDSEPIAGTEKWTRDPFKGEIIDGKIYGWGVADDLAGIAAMVQSLRVLLEANIRPAGDIIIASTPSKRHARGVSALLHQGLSADAALYLHPAESGVGMREVKAYASGQLDFRIEVKGQEPQTTEPHQTGFGHLGHNPIEKALLICNALRQLDSERGKNVHHPRPDKAVGRSTNIMLSYIKAGDPQRLSRMPSLCTIGAALSFPPFEDMAAIQLEVEQAVHAAAQQDDWLKANRPKVLWDAGVSGAEVDENAPLWHVVADAVTAGTGQEPYVNAMHTSSDIRNPIVQKAIPTVALGPLCGDLTQNGSIDEWVDVEDYIRSVKVTALILAAWSGG